MEINEKLDIFYRAAIDAANEQSKSMLGDYKAVYEEALTEYRNQKEAAWKTRERIAQERVRKEVNRAVSEELLQIKKEYHDKQEVHKEELFTRVAEKLAEYRNSEEYIALILHKVKEAQAFAGKEAFTVYLDPKDAGLKDKVVAEVNGHNTDGQNADGQNAVCQIEMSDTSFGGGIRVVIPGKHVLMDESFDSKLLEEKEKFSF